MFTASEPSKPKRRWCRFSLKTLLIVMTVYALVFGWLGSRLDKARQNRERAAAIDEVVGWDGVCGSVTYTHKDRRPQTWMERLFDDPGDAGDPVAETKVTRIGLRARVDADDAFENLRYLPELTEIRCSETVTDAGMEHLKELKQLKVLVVTGIVTDVGLEHIKELKNLEVLVISPPWLYQGKSKITGAGLKHLSGMKNLTVLMLGDTVVDSEDMKHLQGLTNLRRLHLHRRYGGGCCNPRLDQQLYSNEFKRAHVTDAGLKYLKGLTNLERLEISFIAFTDAGLEHMKHMTRLERLNLTNQQITDAGLRHLKGMTSLRKLNLQGTKITDAGLEHVKGMTSLEVLYLKGTKVTDVGLTHLSGLKNLKAVLVGSTAVTRKGAEKLKLQEALPNCVIVHDQWTLRP